MIFLGVLFPRCDEKIIKEKSRRGSVQNQANTFQWNCIDGFYENMQEGLQIINVLPVGTFPFQYKDLFLPTKDWEYNNEIHRQVGGINIPFFKQSSRYRKIKKLLRKSKDKEICIYSTYLPFLKAIQYLDSSYHVKLIVTDLPEYYDYSERVSLIKRFLRKKNNNAIYKCLKRVDSFVLLTEAMKEPLQVGNRPYVIVEGISANIQNLPNDYEKEKGARKIILYTGTLDRIFGIDVLLEAFSLMENNNYELWICGSGDYVEGVKNAANNDSRIKFFGYVTKTEAEMKQKEASILVNPRQNKGEYTKYSFPSKTMEYLASGKPVVAYKLDGIPNEYDNYINYVADNTSCALKEKLVDVLENYESYSVKAQKAIKFIQTKCAKVQAKKILQLGKE